MRSYSKRGKEVFFENPFRSLLFLFFVDVTRVGIKAKKRSKKKTDREIDPQAVAEFTRCAELVLAMPENSQVREAYSSFAQERGLKSFEC